MILRINAYRGLFLPSKSRIGVIFGRNAYYYFFWYVLYCVCNKSTKSYIEEGINMETKQIVFTKINTAELLPVTIAPPKTGEVMVKMSYTAISRGTERANITGNINVGIGPLVDPAPHFPRALGYSGSGTVCEIGGGVSGLAIGDRVAVYNSQHKGYCTLPANNVIVLPYDDIPMEAAAFSYICTFPLAAVRKVKPELGESGIVMGLGILGIMAVQFLRASGVFPVIAVDPVESRRQFALTMGADAAFDPTEPDFAEKVKSYTGGGVNAAIEVSGTGKAFDQVLDCMKRFGRVALLGCTRDSNFTIDYYRKIHGPGITVVGAHTLARPELQSYPGMWTHRDDIGAVLKLQHSGRISVDRLIREIHSPDEAPQVYERVINEKNFPVGVLFDWSKI